MKRDVPKAKAPAKPPMKKDLNDKPRPSGFSEVVRGHLFLLSGTPGGFRNGTLKEASGGTPVEGSGGDLRRDSEGRLQRETPKRDPEGRLRRKTPEMVRNIETAI